MRALLLAATALTLAAPALALDLRADTKSYPTAGLRALQLQLPAGEVTVSGTDDDHVRVTVGVHCDDRHEDRCRKMAERLELDTERRGDALVVKVHDRRKWQRGGAHVRYEVQVPRRLALELEFGAGELEVVDVGRDVRVEMGAGEATLRLRESDVSSVDVAVGVGEAKLRSRGRTYESHGFIAQTLSWDGTAGANHVKVELGAGEVTLHLD